MESRIQVPLKKTGIQHPGSTEWDPEFKTVLFSLTWGDSTGLRTASTYFRARGAVFKVPGGGGGGGCCGVMDFKKGLPGADSIFFTTVTNLSRLITG